MNTHHPDHYSIPLLALFLILIVLVIFSFTLGILLGIGYLLSLLLPFTLFQSTIIVIGHVFLMLIFISVNMFYDKLKNIENWLIDDEDE